MLSCVIIIIGAALQGGAANFGMFIGARILLGIDSCLACAATSPLLAETGFSHPKDYDDSYGIRLLAIWVLYRDMGSLLLLYEI